MKAHIIYENFLSPSGDGMSIGGIQTYINNLSNILSSLNIEVIIYQKSLFDFKKVFENFTVYGYNFEGSNRRLPHFLFNKTRSNIDKNNDILLFGSDTFVVPCEGYNSIAIQHGVFWDKPEHVDCSNLRFFYEFIKKTYHSWNTISRITAVKYLICVDYNFVNWYRSIVPYPSVNMNVIPNFTKIFSNQNKKLVSSPIKIIFARRLFPYRGTRIFTSAILKVLSKYNNIEVTIAGEGPDEEYMKDCLKEYSTVDFIKYSYEQSYDIHSKYDIAVVPTLGSEGTSLSLLEAMSAGCAVVCSNVGGMSNIVIDHYNGLMINPDSQSLYAALTELIDNPNMISILSERARDTVKSAFSYESWSNRWKEIIIKVLKNVKFN